MSVRITCVKVMPPAEDAKAARKTKNWVFGVQKVSCTDVATDKPGALQVNRSETQRQEDWVDVTNLGVRQHVVGKRGYPCWPWTSITGAL